MEHSKQLIFDREGENDAIGYIVTSESGEQLKVMAAGKEMMPVPEREQTHRIYRLLEENCDVIFCTTQNLEDFPFYPVPQFCIFAVDSKGNCFGTIGGCGNIAQDAFPVGYVDANGLYGKLAGNLKEFLELVTFYPYWQEIMRCEQLGIAYDIGAMKIGKAERTARYLAQQQEIAEIVGLSENPKSVALLQANMKSTHGFTVFASREEAAKTYTFVDA